MTAYMKKPGGKRFGSSAEKPAFGARGGKPTGGKPSYDDRPKTFYKATCSNCGNSCEVPFKPVNGKPVFCRDCFVKTGETAGGRASDRMQKREYSRPAVAPERTTDSSAQVLKQLEILNAKIERLILAVEMSAARSTE